MHQRFPSLIFVASNILMFSMPNTALAETCETDNSVFNMPVLLEVALIGAYFYGASLQRQGKYRDAIKYHLMVLAISEREGEDSEYRSFWGNC
uniref:Tetratricopeptide repeat protein n=1 Tax=Cajanus cajan TaxID=3821 RepID=A0A151S6U0_CAJCA|nr:hypothetical protein KK1_027713 [Cajanus cajan]